MKKVYIVHFNSAEDSCDQEWFEVFETYEEAKIYFDDAVKEEKENDHLIGKPNTVIEESDDDFEIYEDGNYCEDHYHAYIIEKEIKKYNKN